MKSHQNINSPTIVGDAIYQNPGKNFARSDRMVSYTDQLLTTHSSALITKPLCSSDALNHENKIMNHSKITSPQGQYHWVKMSVRNCTLLFLALRVINAVVCMGGREAKHGVSVGTIQYPVWRQSETISSIWYKTEYYPALSPDLVITYDELFTLCVLWPVKYCQNPILGHACLPTKCLLPL